MRKSLKTAVQIGSLAAAALMWGCSLEGYSNSWPYPQQYQTVYVEMFDSVGFRRGYEFTATDAIAKMIEARTPYKVVSSEDRADTVLSGVVRTGSAILSGDRYTGTPLEREALVSLEFTWKDLKTGEIIRNDTVWATESFSSRVGQDFEYAFRAAVNKAAQKVVERMEISW